MLILIFISDIRYHPLHRLYINYFICQLDLPIGYTRFHTPVEKPGTPMEVYLTNPSLSSIAVTASSVIKMTN